MRKPDQQALMAWALDTMKAALCGSPEVAQPLRSNPRNNSDPGMEATMRVSANRELRTANRERSGASAALTPEECEILQGFPVGYTLIRHVVEETQRRGPECHD